MKIKMSISGMALCVLCASISFSVQGAELSNEAFFDKNLLTNYSQKDEIEKLTSDILEMANPFSDDGFQANESEIAFSDAYCIYVNANVLENQPETIEEIELLLDSADVVWNIPVYSDGNTVIVQISKAPELDEINLSDLSEAEIESAKEAAGKWQVVASTLYENSKSPEQETVNLLSNGGEESGEYKTILVGGEPGIQSVLALVIKNGVVEGVMSVERDIAYKSSDQRRSETDKSEITLLKDKIYSIEVFSDAASYIKDEMMNLPDSTSGSAIQNHNGYSYAFAGIVLLIIIAGGVVFISMKRKQKIGDN